MTQLDPIVEIALRRLPDGEYLQAVFDSALKRENELYGCGSEHSASVIFCLIENSRNLGFFVTDSEVKDLNSYHIKEALNYYSRNGNSLIWIEDKNNSTPFPINPKLEELSKKLDNVYYLKSDQMLNHQIKEISQEKFSGFYLNSQKGIIVRTPNQGVLFNFRNKEMLGKNLYNLLEDFAIESKKRQ